MAIMVMTHGGICTITLAKLEHTKLLSESKAKQKKNIAPTPNLTTINQNLDTAS